jgi:hypothetical protein
MPQKRMDPARLAWIELSHLQAIGALPAALASTLVAADDATLVFDVDGEELFRRMPLRTRRAMAGYADIATHPAVGEPLIAMAEGAGWNEDELRAAGRRAAHALGVSDADELEVRFVAYSFPKLALQLLRDGREVALLELHSWQPVPPNRREVEVYEPPSNFERWSFLDEMPEDERRRRVERYDAREEVWRGVRGLGKAATGALDPAIGQSLLLPRPFLKYRSRQLHYGTHAADHEVCFELHGQRTYVWCVAASVEMVLDFYRYEYDQVRLATELGLGTLTTPNGLPYSRDGDVVTVLEKMSSNALAANMWTTSNPWNLIEVEIDHNRPLVSFIPGHSRAVAGYMRTLTAAGGLQPFRGLLVYDPAPPTTGVITRWENYDVQTYRVTFNAVLHKA